MAAAATGAHGSFCAPARQSRPCPGTEYRIRLEERLAKLPEEIAAGVQPEEIASAMAESFRQQIADVNLEQSAIVMLDVDGF